MHSRLLGRSDMAALKSCKPWKGKNMDTTKRLHAAQRNEKQHEQSLIPKIELTHYF